MSELKTVERALRLLRCFTTEQEALGSGQLATRLSVHRSTTSRLARALLDQGFLRRSPSGDGYMLGPEVGRLGLLALGALDLVSAAADGLQRLADETGETATLSVADGFEAVTIAGVLGRHHVGSGNWVGVRTGLHCTSDGLVLLAFTPVPLPSDRLQPCTAHTVTDPAAIRARLQDIRRRGWATVNGELEEGLRGVAAPVIDASGRCRAALTVSGPSYRITDEVVPVLADACRRAAGAIGERLVTAVATGRSATSDRLVRTTVP